MKISRYPLTDDLWTVIAPLIGDSFFGSKGFANLWNTKGGKPIYWVAEDTERILAVLPGVEFGIKPFKRFYAMPNGCYSRIFYDPHVSVEDERIARMMLDSLAAADYVKIFIYDFYQSLPFDSRFGIETCTTTLVDISDADWQPPDSKLRQEIRKAVKEGIQVEKFDQQTKFSQFLHLVRLSEKQAGRKCIYSAEFFNALAGLAKEDNRVQWIWCEHNRKAVASLICFIEDDMVFAWQAYYDKTFSFLRPNKYMLFVTAREQALKGVRRLNLGASPEEVQGVVFFKKKWGGVPYDYNCYVMRKGLGKLL
ncbi:MAG: GNAT family N-acetyltransferase [Candidatus Zixiibacteriota bacterium]